MNKLLLVLMTMLLSISTYAQQKITFENGAQFSIDDLDTDPENFPHSELYFGGYLYQGFVGVGGYVYTNPQKYQIKTIIGTNGFGGDFSYFLFSKVKVIDQFLDIHTESRGTEYRSGMQREVIDKYNTSFPTSRVRSLGITGGAEFYKIKKEDGILVGSNDYNVRSLVAGVSMLSSKHVTFFFNKKRKKRKSVTHKYFVGVVYLNTDLVDNTVGSPGDIKSFVPRITYEISTSLFPSGRGGMRFLIGYQSPSGLLANGGTSLLVGLGYRRTLG